MWQPIETAPHDGTVILGWRFYPVAIRWTNNAEYPWEAVQIGSKVIPFMANAYAVDDKNLSHWMPLPELLNDI